MLCCQIHRAEPITQNNWALTRIPYYIRPFGLDEAHNNTLHKPSPILLDCVCYEQVQKTN